MAKTDWMLDDTVLPEDMNQIGEEINANADKLADNLDKQPWEPLTLNPGVQVVQGGDVPAILHPTMQGRTLVNLLGRSGNFESLTGWTTAGAGAAAALDTTNKAYGTSSVKLTVGSAGDAGVFRDMKSMLKTGSYYILVGDCKNGNATRAQLRVNFSGDIGIVNSSGVTDTTAFKPQFIKIQPSDFDTATSVYMYAHVVGSNGQYGYVDGMRLFEITQAEYNALTSMTADQIAAKYPYIDDMKHVNAVYIENKGKNLLPSFSEWNAAGGSATATGPYVLAVTAAAAFEGVFAEISVTKNADMVLNVTHNGRIGAFKTDGSTSLHGGYTTNQQIAFNAGENDRIRIYFTSTAAGPFNFSNPMLNIGSEALPFEPQKPSYLYLPDCNLRSNVDGSVADRLYTDGQGKPRVTRRFRERVLDGSLQWEYSIPLTGSKVVKSPSFDSNVIKGQGQGVAIKYNGNPLKNLFGSVGTTWQDPDLWQINSNELWLSIPNTDSGWGEYYTPTAEEIKAYFWGWKMVDGSLNPYPGNGTKYWVYANGLGGWTGTTTILPTDFSPAVTNKTISSYRLMYQLAQSVDEPVTYEGSLMLHEGANQVEVGAGVVVREAVVPSGPNANGYYAINAISASYPTLNPLSRRAERITQVYKDANADKSWEKGSALVASWYGGGYAYTQTKPSQSATYSVTYLALDTYTLGIAPQTISAEYAPNIRESVESLVREVIEARTETSVLQNTKAQKQQPQWIAPTLRNDWAGTVRYMKDEFGNVHLKGYVSGGVMTGTSTVIFALPTGYRPSVQASIPTVTSEAVTSNPGSLVVYVLTNGNVVFEPTSKNVIFFNCTFRLD
ncbi:hypothetical protein J4772_11550 [Cohnella sp. LGH]|uniref:hypothetical protein n=1 Tax=Cohnella sp. LGH TaxID=1619153 RepID=UPI001ADA39B9|nr:hypothetical protein [Cohnella sp. LGH]QTH44973.1 hypothetical protein J4772_11550 [Cohnella sp. LGH]